MRHSCGHNCKRKRRGLATKILRQQVGEFENSRMTSSGMVMVTSNDRVVQASISRDIDMALVNQDACIIVPVGEV